MATRPDDTSRMTKLTGKHTGETALLVLGGYSAEGWESLRDTVKPDKILIANGVNAKITNADYWLLAENMTRSSKLKDTDPRQQAFFDILNRKGATTRFVSHRSWNLLDDKRGAISIRRKSYDTTEIPRDFSIRKYGEGLWGGWYLKHKEAGALVMVGTVALHLLHLAGILGFAKVHTIGFDLMFRESERHHWYPYPIYEADRYRNEKMFVEYLGVKTQHFWIESAEYMKFAEGYFEGEGMIWKDHSNGLLSIMGLDCTKKLEPKENLEPKGPENK